MKYTSATIALLTGLLSTQAFSTNITVKITNLTNGNYFTPLLVTAHPAGTHLFQVGTAASTQLTAMAEGGDLTGLEALTASLNAVTDSNPNGGPLAPAASTTTDSMDIDTTNTQLSITAMVLPTNDAFVGLNAWTIPTTPGTYTFTLDAYDAGTEANNELIVDGSGTPGTLGIPADPGSNQGTNGTGVTTTENNTNVHIHRGVLGDTNATGGTSDLNSTIHRWLNPVARVTVTVTAD